jgi:outer membrane protein assembly factor BamB
MSSPRPQRAGPARRRTAIRSPYRLRGSKSARVARWRAGLTTAALILIAGGVAWSLTRSPSIPATPATPGPRPSYTTTGPAGTPAAPAASASTPDVAVGGSADGVKVATFLGGALRRSYGIGPAPTRLGLIWKVKLGSGTTRRKIDNKPVWWAGSGWTGQCTVVRDKSRDYLLIGGYDHRLHKIDALTGKIVWEYSFDDVIKSTNTVFSNPDPTGDADRIMVVAGSRRGSNYEVGDKRIAPLRAVSFTTGKELWRFPIPKTVNYSQDVDSSPLLVDGVLYAGVESGYVYAIDPFHTKVADGHRRPVVLARSPRLFTAADAKAHPDLGQANVALEASPARVGDILYMACGSGHIYGLKIPSLEIVWDFKTGSDIDGTTVVARDGTLLQAIEKEYVSRPGGVYGFDPSRPPALAPLWYSPTGNRGFSEWEAGVVGSVAINDESDKQGRHPRLAAYIAVDGYLHVIARDAFTAHAVKGPGAATPSKVPVEVFRDSVGAGISTPIIVGDSIVAAGYDRKVRLYRITYSPVAKGAHGALPSPDGSFWTVKVAETSSYTAGNGFESTPLVWGRRVYIGCRDGYLYCLGNR